MRAPPTRPTSTPRVQAGAFEGLRRAIRDLGPTRDHRDDRRAGPARAWRGRLTRPRPSGGPPPTREAARRYVVANGYGADPASGTDRSCSSATRTRSSRARPSPPSRSARARRSSRSAPRRPRPSAALESAIGAAEDAGFIGFDALGSGRRSWSTVRTVQGAYMLGEETVLLKALEGKRGQPEQRPPHPAERGLFGQPTVVHNVQTLAAVPWIIRNGAERVRGHRRPGQPRHDPRPGPRRRPATGSPRSRSERPCARSSRSAAALPAGRSIKAILVGGPSGGLLPPERSTRRTTSSRSARPAPTSARARWSWPTTGPASSTSPAC